MKINTELVAHGEHIADDLADTLSEVGLELTEAQLDKLVEFVQAYIETSIETVLENPEWFDGE